MCFGADVMKKGEFKKIMKKVQLMAYLDYKDFFIVLFRHLKKADEKITYKEYSRLLGLPPSNVIDHIMKNRRPLSQKAAEKMAMHLGFDLNEKKYLLQLVRYVNHVDGVGRDMALEELIQIREHTLSDFLPRRELEYYSKWYHIVIGEMAALDCFRHDVHWIAKHLPIPIRPSQIRQSLQLLEELEILVFDDQKRRYVRSSKNFSTSSEIRGHAFRGLHQQMLDVAKSALVYQDQKDRDISCLTIAINQRGVDEIKGKIHKLQVDVLEVEDRLEKPENIYQLNVQFFAATKL